MHWPQEIHVRRYLLGGLDDGEAVRRIEERILLDDTFGDLIAAAEGELMEDYLDGNLDETDRVRFVQHFLAAPERRADLQLITQLRKIATKSKLKAIPGDPSPRLASKLRAFFASKPIAAAAAVLIMLTVSIGVWRITIYRSDTDKGLAQLQTAYRGRRPFESRVTGFPDHTVYTETRGSRSQPVDTGALDRAHRYLNDAAADPTDWRAHHSLGLYYFAAGDLDRARREFDLAGSRKTSDPRLLADTGALFLETAKKEISEGKEDAAIVNLNASLRSLNAAISLAPSLAEPRFNKALCLQWLKDVDQAKTAWREYVALDSTSPWADEARQNLQKLEEENLPPRSAADLESDYLIAHRRGDKEAARTILRSNRELVRETYIPLRLARSLVNADPGARVEFLGALKEAAELELTLTKDPFARSIASYYAAATQAAIEKARNIQAGMADGYNLLRVHDYRAAEVRFRAARSGFDRVGNPSEARIAQYLLGYALVSGGQPAEGRRELLGASEFARVHGYSWLDATALYWVGGSYVKSKDHGKAEEAFRKALTIAELIDDPYSSQRNALELSNLYSYSGRRQPALKHLYRALSLSAEPGSSERQRYRSLIDAFVTFSRLKLYDAALPKVLEAVTLADRMRDDFWRSQSRNFAGVAYVQLNDIATARAWLSDGAKLAVAMGGSAAGEALSAFSQLKLGDAERAAGNPENAERHYRDAIAFFDRAEMPASRDEAHKGLLLTLISLGRGNDLEGEIAKNIDLVESYRATIRGEEDRMSFLATRGNIYDVATDFEFRRGDLRRAFEFSEMSSGRSLLDQLETEPLSNVEASSSENRLRRRTTKVSFSEMQRGIPVGVQVVRYSVLDDRTLAWVVDPENVDASEIGISASSLEAKIDAFRKAIIDVGPVDDPVLRELGQELYALLIGPIRDSLDSKSEICIVPSGDLFKLPFAALITPEGNPLVTEFSLLYSPSMRTFLRATDSARAKSTGTEESLLSIGNPAFDRDRFDYLPNLPAAEAEARAVAEVYQTAQTLLGTDASESAFIAEMERADVIHFAGHYVPVHGSPDDSFLLLAAGKGYNSDNGAVTNKELAGRKLPRAKLLTLAACQSGAELVYPGEGMIGISRTMLAADVPLVVGSQWSVDSSSTAKLMTLFHRFRKREGLSTTMSLRRAQLELATEASGPLTAPYHWAAFSVYGGHADF